MTNKTAIINDPQFIHHMYDEWLHLAAGGYLHPGETFARFMMSMSNTRGQTTHRRSRHRRIPVLMGGAAFLPSDIAGLQLWLDGADTSTLFQDAAKTTAAGNGDVVGAWADKSGNGLDVTQTTTSKKPLARFANLNGLTTVEFDGTDDFLENTTLSAQAQPHTFFAVARSLSKANFRIIVDSRAAAFALMGQDFASGFARINAGTLVEGSVDRSGAYHIWGGVINGANSSVRIDGAIDASGDVGANSFTPIRIGTDVAETAPFDDNICEFLWVNREVALSEILNIENYLRTKWGTP